jgi:CelD/BcsL family acetyltransferase involved in cellulose biosynthesis
MSMAVAIDSTAEAPPSASRIERLHIINSLAEAEPIWRDLEARSAALTPYQRFDFLAAWQRNIGRQQILRPLIVVAYDAQRRPVLLLPLAIEQRNAVRIASFMGGKHANLNMALWDKDFAGEAGAVDLEILLRKIRDRGIADVLALTQQPMRWRDQANPLALLPHQPSVNRCPLLIMEPRAAPTELIGNSLRSRLKSKERKLKTLSGYRYRVASGDEDIRRLLDWFFRTKPLRMAEQKLPNVFAEPGVEAFVREACMAELAVGGHAIDLHILECDEEIIALFAGVADCDRFSMMFNTYTISSNSRYSPGLILIRNIVDHYAGLGYRAIDLGIGSDEYKRLFCKNDEPIFDCFVPLSGRGRPVAAALALIYRGKHLVKQNPRLSRLVHRLRGFVH